MFPVSFLNSILEFSNFTLLKTKASRNVEEQWDYQTGCKNGFSLGWGTWCLPFANALHNLLKLFNFLNHFCTSNRPQLWLVPLSYSSSNCFLQSPSKLWTSFKNSICYFYLKIFNPLYQKVVTNFASFVLKSNSPKEKKRYSHKQALDIDEANTVSITINHLPPRISLGVY